MADPRYRVFGLHDLEHSLTPTMREDMASHYDKDQDMHGPHEKADYLSSVLSNLRLQMTKGPAHIVTRTTLDDNGFETLYGLRVCANGDRRLQKKGKNEKEMKGERGKERGTSAFPSHKRRRVSRVPYDGTTSKSKNSPK